VPDFHLDGDKKSDLVTSLALVRTAQERVLRRLFIHPYLFMEMGPLGFSVNAIDPILVFNGHEGILEVRINSEAQKWGGRWTCPIREAKWGRSCVGPNAFCALIGGV